MSGRLSKLSNDFSAQKHTSLQNRQSMFTGSLVMPPLTIRQETNSQTPNTIKEIPSVFNRDTPILDFNLKSTNRLSNMSKHQKKKF